MHAHGRTSALWSLGMWWQSVFRGLVACSLLLASNGCAPLGTTRARSYYDPNLDHVTFEKMQRARTDEASGNYQEALRELLQIDAEGDSPKPVGADAPWSISTQSPEYHQLRLWEDHQGQLSWTREMIGDLYAEGRLGTQDLSRAATWYEKAIYTDGAGLSAEHVKLKLAFMYENGLGVPKSHARAEQILDLTSARQNEARIRQEEQEQQMWLAVIAYLITHPGSSSSSASASEPGFLECHFAGGFAGMIGCPPWKWP